MKYKVLLAAAIFSASISVAAGPVFADTMPKETASVMTDAETDQEQDEETETPDTGKETPETVDNTDAEDTGDTGDSTEDPDTPEQEAENAVEMKAKSEVKTGDSLSYKINYTTEHETGENPQIVFRKGSHYHITSVDTGEWTGTNVKVTVSYGTEAKTVDAGDTVEVDGDPDEITITTNFDTAIPVSGLVVHGTTDADSGTITTKSSVECMAGGETVAQDSVSTTVLEKYRLTAPTMSASSQSVKYQEGATLTINGISNSGSPRIKEYTATVKLPGEFFIDTLVLPRFSNADFDVYVDGVKQTITSSASSVYVNKAASEIQFVVKPSGREFSQTGDAVIQFRSLSTGDASVAAEVSAKAVYADEHTKEASGNSLSFTLSGDPNADNPDTPDNPDQPDNPDTPDTPDTPVTPDKPDNPDTPVTPINPDTPVNPDKPNNPDTPSDNKTNENKETNKSDDTKKAENKKSDNSDSKEHLISRVLDSIAHPDSIVGNASAQATNAFRAQISSSSRNDVSEIGAVTESSSSDDEAVASAEDVETITEDSTSGNASSTDNNPVRKDAEEQASKDAVKQKVKETSKSPVIQVIALLGVLAAAAAIAVKFLFFNQKKENSSDTNPDAKDSEQSRNEDKK